MTVARRYSPHLHPLVGRLYELRITLGEWLTNGNAVWSPVQCDGLNGLWDVWAAPHLCIGCLTQEATRFDPD